MDRSRGYSAKWNKWDREIQIAYALHLHVKLKKKKLIETKTIGVLEELILIETGSRMVAAKD